MIESAVIPSGRALYATNLKKFCDSHNIAVLKKNVILLKFKYQALKPPLNIFFS